MSRSSELTASVAIVSWKTPQLAAHCWASIMRQQRYPAWLDYVEIVYADHRDLGYAEALDSVFGKCDSPILIALNADTELPAEDITPLLELFNEHPKLGLLGPRQVNPHGWLVHAGIPEPGDTSGGRCYGRADIDQYREPFELIAQVSGSVMFIRRAAYEEIGGFRDMPRMYYEDAIFARRLHRAGWQVGYSGMFDFVHRVASSPCENRAELAAEGKLAWERELNGELVPMPRPGATSRPPYPATWPQQ